MRWIERPVVVAALCLAFGACTPAGVAPPPQSAAAPAYYDRLGPQTDTPRYDYPGPALTGGCVC